MSEKERYRIGPYTNPSGERVFRVNGRTPSGEQVRRNFRTFEEAIGHKAELEIAAVNAVQAVRMKRTRLSDDQLAEAEAAFKKLEGTSHKITDAVEFLLRNWKPSLVVKTVSAAATQFLAEKTMGHLRPRTIQDYKTRVNRLVRACGERLVHEVTVDELKRVIAPPGNAARTKNGNRRVLYTFFEWCVKVDYCPGNPVEKIDTARVEDVEPKILTLSEVRALLRAALDYKEGVLVPYIALSLFAGLRPAELERIKWTNIDLKERLITVRGDAAKLRKRRTIEVSENLVVWLLPYVTRPIVGKNFRRDFEEVRRMAGFQGRGSETKPEEGLKPWVDDILRHTALSHHLGHHKHEGKTAAWAGNSPDILQKSYKGLVNPEDSAAYWFLSPDNLGTVVLRLPAAA
jgi:integrase